MVMLAVTMYIQPRMKALAKHSFEDGQTKHSVMVESLTGLETLKLLGAGGFMRRRLREVLERQADISEQTKDVTHLSTNVAQTMQQMVQMSVVATGAILVADGSSGLGRSLRRRSCRVKLSHLLRSCRAASPTESDRGELRGPERVDVTTHRASRRQIIFASKSVQGVGGVQGCYFHLSWSAGPVLQNVSFKIEPGERVAILGHVGSGKTTIGRLIAGLYEADSGMVLVDGVIFVRSRQPILGKILEYLPGRMADVDQYRGEYLPRSGRFYRGTSSLGR